MQGASIDMFKGAEGQGIANVQSGKVTKSGIGERVDPVILVETELSSTIGNVLAKDIEAELMLEERLAIVKEGFSIVIT